MIMKKGGKGEERGGGAYPCTDLRNQHAYAVMDELWIDDTERWDMDRYG